MHLKYHGILINPQYTVHIVLRTKPQVHTWGYQSTLMGGRGPAGRKITHADGMELSYLFLGNGILVEFEVV